MSIEVSPKPFIKWVGGKTQLMPTIQQRYPKTISSYCEPFLGGGAVMLDVLSKNKDIKVIANDMNKELINTFIQVRDNIDPLIISLRMLETIFHNSAPEEQKAMYYKNRLVYNKITVESNALEKASLFIFLNKTCFNGLYRVNKDGLFNVPMGKYSNPTICDEDNLRVVSDIIKNVEFMSVDYEVLLEYVEKDMFMYIDPPYRPINKSSSFTNYTNNGFDDNEQRRLCAFMENVWKLGGKVLASNSDPKNTDKNDDFFDRLYVNFDIERVSARRNVNSKGSNRGKISELLVRNYTLGDEKNACKNINIR